MSFPEGDDAVSEVLGFVIITGIITAAVTIVLMIGYPMYQNTVTDAHMTNMEEGFTLLSSNGNKVAMSESPVQSSELKLYGGTIWMKDDGNVNISGYSGSDRAAYLNVKPMALEYTLGDKDVGYTMGGVFKNKDGMVDTLKEPLAYFYDTSSPPALVLPMAVLQNNGQAMSGIDVSRVTVSSTYYSKSLMVISYPSAQHADNVDTVFITLNSEYNDALKSYYEGLRDNAGNPLFHVNSDSNGVLVLEGDFNTGTGFPNGITLYIIPCYLDISIQ